jgi:uncharacterized repeat protein (TIGR01451 family)
MGKLKHFQTSWILCVVTCVISLSGISAKAWGDDPNDFNDLQGVFTVTRGAMDSGFSCPAWEEVLSRNGSDGGQLTIELDTCQVFVYEITSMPQSGGAGSTAELVVDDLIIVWDEDAGHGENYNERNFSFTGLFVPDPNVADPNDGGYVRLTTTDSRTNWAVYRVTESGLFTKGNNGTNEHELIHTSDIALSKEADPNEWTCVVPEEEILYTICYQNRPDMTFENVYILDRLPAGVDYDYILSIDPLVIDTNYNIAEHTYRWDLGTVEGGESGCVQLLVTVNTRSEPLGILHNIAEIWDSNSLLGRAEQDNLVCCWGGDVIYADRHAPGYIQNGTCWAYAYQDLQMALARAERGCGSEIWVADGVYNPGDTLDPFEEAYADTFVIPDGVSVYGGYMGYGASNPNTRDPKRYQTILSGYVDEATRNNTVVTMGHNSLLDGVIIEEGYFRGIEGSDVTSTVANCIIKKNAQRGINCLNGNMAIQWCEIKGNGQQGIYHEGYGKWLTIENSKIHDNQQDGVYTVSSTSTVLNSLIYQNGLEISPSAYYGINLLNPFSNPTIRNCTIAYNVNEGIRCVGSDQNRPNVWSCILFANNADDNYIDLSGCKEPWHCCLTDPNNLDQPISDPPRDARWNIRTNPGFAYPYPVYGYFHLAADSPCIDKGEPNAIGPNETDIDGDDRDGDGLVDIGADEVTCEDTINPNDWNGDGVINYEEFAILSHAWLSCDPNSPAYPNPNNPDPNDSYIWYVQRWGFLTDMNKDSCVDLADLDLFMANWLWEACWRENYMEVWGVTSGSQELMMMSMMTDFEVYPSMAGYDVSVEEKTIEQQILDLEEIIEFLEKIWLEESDIQEAIDPEDWKDFMDAVYNNLFELQTVDIQCDC